ncbi:MAG: NAD(P)/FAD-dependent oxidoreductase [Sporichthyaceae bacterium]
MKDLIVAGGGPIGLATAICARLAGMSVTVVEPRTAPVDKACGEGLMPGAVERLRELGVHPPGRAFHGIRYLSPTRTAEARFRAGPGLGVRRTDLHAALLARADELGVEQVRGRVDDVVQESDQVHAAGLRARWLVAADGLHSPVRRVLGLDRSIVGAPRFGQRRHFRVPAWTELVEVHWSGSAEAYVTPVADDVVGVAALCGQGRRFEDVLTEFPALVDRLSGAVALSELRGAGPLRQDVTARRSGRVLLVGDAAGYVDALTGEGLATGLATAAAAVEALVTGRPQDYEQAWRRATRRYRLLTGALLRASQVQAVRPHIVPAASRLPRVFAGIVELLA